jgi:hypothetical protein
MEDDTSQAFRDALAGSDAGSLDSLGEGESSDDGEPGIVLAPTDLLPDGASGGIGGAASSSGGALDPGPGRFQLGGGLSAYSSGALDPGPGRFQLGGGLSSYGSGALDPGPGLFQLGGGAATAPGPSPPVVEEPSGVVPGENPERTRMYEAMLTTELAALAGDAAVAGMSASQAEEAVGERMLKVAMHAAAVAARGGPASAWASSAAASAAASSSSSAGPVLATCWSAAAAPAASSSSAAAAPAASSSSAAAAPAASSISAAAAVESTSEDEIMPKFSVPKRITELTQKCNQLKDQVRTLKSDLRSARAASARAAAKVGDREDGKGGKGTGKGKVANNEEDIDERPIAQIVMEPLNLTRLELLGKLGARVLLSNGLSLAQQSFVDLKRCEAARGSCIQVVYKEDTLSHQLGLQGRLCSGVSSIRVIDQATKNLLPLSWGLTPYEMTCSTFAVDKAYKEAVRDERCRDFDLCKSFPAAVLRRHGSAAAPCVDEWVRNPQAF